MNPIPFKYLETYEVTSLDQLLSLVPCIDEATHTSYQPSFAWWVWFFESDEDTDIPFWFLDEPMEDGHEFDSEVIPF